MRRLISRLVLTTGFALIALLASVGGSSGVSAGAPYPECGPASVPCAGFGYPYYGFSTPYFVNRPLVAYAPTYAPTYVAPTYFYDGVYISSNVFTRNGCAVGNYTCLRNKGVRMSYGYAPYGYAFGYGYP